MSQSAFFSHIEQAKLDPNHTVARAYLLMERYKLKALPVVSHDEVVGVVSEKDILKLIETYQIQENTSVHNKVHHLMQSPVKSVEHEESLGSVIQDMLNKRVVALVIKRDSKTLGYITRDNLLELLAQLFLERGTKVSDCLSFKANLP